MKFFKTILLFFTLLSLIGCAKEEEFNNTETKVGDSRVTFFPLLERKGKAVMSVVKGATFTDPGITATEGGQNITVTTTGAVNTNTVGYYTLTYTATNKDGFSSSSQRTVIVIPEAEKPGVDLSGEYKAIGGAPSNAFITKLDAGIYYTTNSWGGGSLAVIPAYFISIDGSSVLMPLQNLNNGAGRIQTATAGTYVNGLLKWTVTRLDFGSGPLTVQKSWQKL